MGPFNWVDAIIILLVIGSAFIGRRLGLLRQLFVTVGFFSGLFFSGWLFPHILPIHDRTVLTVVNGNLVLLSALYAAIRGFDLGRRFHFSLARSKAHLGYLTESGLGVMLSTAGVLVAVWLLAATVGRLPFEGFSNSADDAYIVQLLDRHLPPVPAVLAEFNRLVDANTSPQIFVQPVTRAEAAGLPSPQSLQAAITEAGAATVRITSFGCGGIVSGSGFVVGPGLVATNAHVIAGVQRPIIKAGGRSYAGVPVLFDSNLDFAVLRVAGLKLKPLPLAPEDVAVKTAVAVLGYPNGNYVVSTGVIRNNFVVFGTNIYDEGVVGRDTYEVQTLVDPGSSGGPIVLANGKVAGIIFAKSDSVNDDGYAISSASLTGKVHQVLNSTRRVSTGVCLAN